jgi:phage tail-like protein
MPRLDPLPAFNFMVGLFDSTGSNFAALKSFAGLFIGGFSECSGLESTMETYDFLEGGVNDRVHHLPSRFTFSNITLRRGVGFGDDLWLWHKDFMDGKGKRRDGVIILQNETQIPIKIWVFTGGLPVRWSGPSLNATASDVSIEALEIAHQKLELRVSPGALISQATGP